jgi:hypothetical protein
MTNKIIFLGAGASKDTGYPLASELYAELEKHSITYGCNYKKAWAQFNEVINFIKNGYICSDLEYLITLIMLLENINKKQFYDNWRKYIRENNPRNKFPCNLDDCTPYKLALNGLSECLEIMLGDKNYNIEKNDYEYLLTFLNKHLSMGDTIITTNYDLLTERALSDLDWWHIEDGYGFEVTLSDTWPKTIRQKPESSVESAKAPKSRIKILKLHGSIGWVTDPSNDKELIIKTEVFTHILSNGIKDSKYDSPFHDSRRLILPTFLKNYQNITLHNIWSQASQAIDDAEEIHIIGYSLPEYDDNIRALLLPLHNNLTRNKCSAKIYLKDMQERDRWEKLLGKENITFIPIKSFKDYCEKLYGLAA